jgi:hypothetical protein
VAAWRSFLLAATSAVFDGRGQMLTRPVSPSHQETHVGYGTWGSKPSILLRSRSDRHFSVGR